MLKEKMPELSPEERAMSISKYYDLPVPELEPLQMQLLQHPLSEENITRPEDVASLIRPEGYTGYDYGYCMMSDGAGYVATYTHFRNCTLDMLKWWFAWLNTKPQNMPEGLGNIKYKVWCPYGHWDHGLADDGSGTVVPRACEALDLGEDGDPYDNIYMHDLDVRDFGVTQETIDRLNEMGCTYGINYETFDYPGAHFCMSMMRPHPNGGVEGFGREWMGYTVRDGKLVRDEATPVDEAFLKKVVKHCTIEMMRLDAILPAIYAEYHDRPLDAAL